MNRKDDSVCIPEVSLALSLGRRPHPGEFPTGGRVPSPGEATTGDSRDPQQGRHREGHHGGQSGAPAQGRPPRGTVRGPIPGEATMGGQSGPQPRGDYLGGQSGPPVQGRPPRGAVRFPGRLSHSTNGTFHPGVVSTKLKPSITETPKWLLTQ